jgi:hypothetical protein
MENPSQSKTLMYQLKSLRSQFAFTLKENEQLHQINEELNMKYMVLSETYQSMFGRMVENQSD